MVPVEASAVLPPQIVDEQTHATEPAVGSVAENFPFCAGPLMRAVRRAEAFNVEREPHMPVGLFVLVVLSFTIFRQAKRSGRRGWLWIGLLWMSTVGTGLAVTALSGFYLVYVRGTIADEYELRVMLRTPAAIGMLIGAFAATARASTPAAQRVPMG